MGGNKNNCSLFLMSSKIIEQVLRKLLNSFDNKKVTSFD